MKTKLASSDMIIVKFEKCGHSVTVDIDKVDINTLVCDICKKAKKIQQPQVQ